MPRRFSTNPIEATPNSKFLNKNKLLSRLYGTTSHRVFMMRAGHLTGKRHRTDTSVFPHLSKGAENPYISAMQNGPNSSRNLDTLTLVSLAGTAAVLVAVVLLFTVPGLGDLATAGYDTMYSAMNYMAEMCRF